MFRPVAMCLNAVVVKGSYAELGLAGVNPYAFSPRLSGRTMPPPEKSIAERLRSVKPST